MALSYKPTITPRERILAIGVAGTGKSNAILTVARRCPDSRFYVLDNDFAYDRLLATDFVDLTNVEVIPVDDWADYIPEVKRIGEVMGKDDWLVIDSMTGTWPSVQTWFVEKVHGVGDDDYFMQVRMAKKEANDKKKTLGALDGWMDWPVINKTYFKLYNALLRVPGHVYLTAEADKISDEDDSSVKNMFGAYGVKPRGQKRMAHVVQTVLLLTKSRAGDYAMTTIKDRGRKEMEAVGVADWSKDYLVAVAGWRPMRVEELGNVARGT